VFGVYARLSDFGRLVGRDESTPLLRGSAARRPISPALRSTDRVSTERPPFVVERIDLGDRVITRCSRCVTVFEWISLDPWPSSPPFVPVGRLRITRASFSPGEYLDVPVLLCSSATAPFAPVLEPPFPGTEATCFERMSFADFCVSPL
jgi:hypothetical protein